MAIRKPRKIVKIVVNEEDDEQNEMPAYYEYGTVILAHERFDNYFGISTDLGRKNFSWVIRKEIVSVVPKITVLI